MKRSCGFTLIELIITIVIGTAVFLTVVPMVETFGREETAKRLNRDADVLLEAMNQFYSRHCTDLVFPTVDVAALRTEGLLFGGAFINPWGGALLLTIDRSIPRNPKLLVTLEFTRVVDAEYVAGFSKNAFANGPNVTWMENTTLSRSVDGIFRQLDREAFGTPLC